MTRRLQRHEKVDDSEFVDRERKKTPEDPLEGDRMFDERVTGVRQSCIADILLELGRKDWSMRCRADSATNLEEGQVARVSVQSLRSEHKRKLHTIEYLLG